MMLVYRLIYPFIMVDLSIANSYGGFLRIPSLRLVLCPQPAVVTQNRHGIRAEDRDGGTGDSHGEAPGV